MGEGQNSPMNDSLKQPLFSSTRERRLWVWVLAVVVAIYSTLGLAAKLVRLVPDERLIGNLMVFCFFLFLVTILTQGLKRRRKLGETWRSTMMVLRNCGGPPKRNWAR